MKKSLIINGCWALAVFVAFGLGSKNGASSAGEKADKENRANGFVSSARLEESQADRKAALANGRNKEGGEVSKLNALFGNVASASGNLDLLIEQALRDSNPIMRRLAFSRLLESLTPENAESIREQLVSLGASEDQWRDFHYSWGAIAGKAAFDHAAASKEPDLAITMTGWAAANPSEALALLKDLPPEFQGKRDELTASVVAGLSHSDANLATDLVLRLGQEGNAQASKLMGMVADETLRSKGPEQASQWAESLPDGALKGSAMSRIAESYAKKDPLAAAEWAQRFADKDYAAKAIEQVGGRWAQTNPAAAAGWLDNLPAGSGQTSGLRNVFDNWEDSDPAAAGKYLQAMPISPKRDSAVSGFATGIAWQNPQAAIAWAQDISDPGLRQTSLTRVGQVYFQRDPAAARAWLEASGLPAATQQQIVKPIDRR